MADTLALEKLFDDVAARMSTEGTLSSTLQSFGWREPPKQAQAPRITWTPGDPQGNAGALQPPRETGTNPRWLAQLEELCTVRIYSQDSTSPENERAQWKSTRLLYDAWMRAVYLAARGNVRVISSKWVAAERAQRRHGTTLEVLIAILSPIPDVAAGVAPADTSAVITPEIVGDSSASPVDVTADPTIVVVGSL